MNREKLTALNEKANIAYVFPKQRIFLQSQSKRKTLIAGRAFGKTYILLLCIGYVAKLLPRAKFFLSGLTFKQILDIVLADANDAWTRLGWFEYNEKINPFGNFVLFREPPANWPRPYKPPKSWDRCITFNSGFCLQLLSFERPDSNRGHNFDGGFIDESALFKEDWVVKILMATLYRANSWRFRDHFLHNAFYDFTSNPWSVAGQWVYKTEDLMKANPQHYLFLEGTAYDNPTLHPQYVKNLEESLPPLVFRVEVLNERLAKLPNSYYPSFDYEKHCPYQTFDYDKNEDGIWVPTSSDYDPTKAIEVSFDFNASICSATISQDYKRTLKISNNFFSKVADENLTLVETLCRRITQHYSGHTRREVFFYGDAYGGSKSAGAKQTFFTQAEQMFRNAGWKVVLRVIKFNPAHEVKFALIDKILAESDTRYPAVRINQNTCKALIISIQNSPILPNFIKDKSSERTSIQQEYATHLSDCLDYLLYAKYVNPNSTPRSAGGMRWVGGS